MTKTGTQRSGDFELSYRIEGQGLTALVIGSAVYYPRTFSEELKRSLRLVFIDHRGFAKCSRPATAADADFDTVLSDVEEMRKSLELGRVIVIGHSGHGYMALEYAKRFPENVSHVVMIATGPSHSVEDSALGDRIFEEAVCPDRKAWLANDLAKLPAELEAKPESRFITFCLRLAAKSWYDFKFDASDLWRDVTVQMPIMDHLWGEVFRDIDVTRGLAKLEVPVLLALGKFDYLVSPYAAWQSRRSSFNDLTVKVFEHSGHTPQLEESGLFDETLLSWLQAKSGRAPAGSP